MRRSTSATCTRPTKSGRPCGNVARGRTPAPESCWGHLTEAEQAEDRAPLRPLLPRLGAEPACWSWPVTDDIREFLALAELAQQPVVRATLRVLALTELTQGRCGLCGAPGANVEDHDHDTGLIRGDLCRSCNIKEGMNRGRVFQLYRKRNPYSMLGLEELYVGRGWADGQPVGAAR